ncbi:MAG: heme-binding protein [Planctomycetota bacterium]
MKRRMLFLTAILVIVGVGLAAWTMTVRAGYESAKYRILESDGSIEIREYPDLMLAVTPSKLSSKGRDGSFMRLFRYISGANQDEQKIAMTTPVFMERTEGAADGSMSFVMPQAMTTKGVPQPIGDEVMIRKRNGGRFAVIRFSGRLDSQTTYDQERLLREWLGSRGLKGDPKAESAGYDPPFTPGPFRRNEVLIRLVESEVLRVTKDSEPAS